MVRLREVQNGFVKGSITWFCEGNYKMALLREVQHVYNKGNAKLS